MFPEVRCPHGSFIKAEEDNLAGRTFPETQINGANALRLYGVCVSQGEERLQGVEGPSVKSNGPLGASRPQL